MQVDETHVHENTPTRGKFLFSGDPGSQSRQNRYRLSKAIAARQETALRTFR